MTLGQLLVGGNKMHNFSGLYTLLSSYKNKQNLEVCWYQFVKLIMPTFIFLQFFGSFFYMGPPVTLKVLIAIHELALRRENSTQAAIILVSSHHA